MEDIKTIINDIEEEIEGAEKYAKRAAKFKDRNRDLASKYYTMANEELGHVNNLHSQAAQIIKAYKAEGHEPPAAMQAVWDWEHEKMIEHTARIKHLLEHAR